MPVGTVMRGGDHVEDPASTSLGGSEDFGGGGASRVGGQVGPEDVHSLGLDLLLGGLGGPFMRR